MTAVALLRPNSLYVYYTDKSSPVGGEFPKTAVADMEVVSEEALSATISKLIPYTGTAGISTILVVSDDLCFIKPLIDGEKVDSESSLIGEVPFSQVATAKMTAHNQQYIIATNQDLYESVGRSLHAQRHEVNLVVAWPCLVEHGLTHGEIEAATIKRIFDNITLLRDCRFPLTAEPKQEISPGLAPQKSGKKKIPLGWILFGAVSLLYAFAMYWFFIRTA